MVEKRESTKLERFFIKSNFIYLTSLVDGHIYEDRHRGLIVVVNDDAHNVLKVISDNVCISYSELVSFLRNKYHIDEVELRNFIIELKNLGLVVLSNECT